MNTFENGQTVTFVAISYDRPKPLFLANYMPGHDKLNTVQFVDLTITEQTTKSDGYGGTVKACKAVDTEGLPWTIRFGSDGPRARLACETEQELIENSPSFLGKDEEIDDAAILWGMQDATSLVGTIHRGIFNMDGEDSVALEKWFHQYMEMLENHVGEPLAILPTQMRMKRGPKEWTTVILNVCRVSEMPSDEPVWCSNEEFNRAYRSVDRQRILDIEDDHAETDILPGHKFKTRPNPFTTTETYQKEGDGFRLGTRIQGITSKGVVVDYVRTWGGDSNYFDHEEDVQRRFNETKC